MSFVNQPNRLVVIGLLGLVGCDSRTSTPVSPTGLSGTPSSIQEVVSGRVTDNGLRPVADVVLTSPRGVQTRSGAQGEYSIPAESTTGLFRASRDGFEDRTFGVALNGEVVGRDVVLQRVLAVGDHDSVSVALTPVDWPQYVGEPYESDYCNNCEVVRLRISPESSARVQVEWTGGQAIAAWIDGRKLESQGTTATGHVVGAVQDRLLYLGVPTDGAPVQRLERAVIVQVSTAAR